MGNKDKDNHSIRLKKNSSAAYYPGETIHGSVVFSITQVVRAETVICRIQGEERTCVSYTTTSHTGKSSRTMHHSDKARCVFVAAGIPLKSDKMICNGVIQPGTYVLPFEVSLPTKILPTMRYGLASSTCAVNFFISAFIKQNNKDNYLTCKQNVSLNFMVSLPPLSETPVPYYGEPVKTDMNVCLCSYGYILFGARVSDTLVDQDEEVEVIMSCRNHTNAKIKKITAKLIEKVFWKGQRKTKYYDRTITEQVFPVFPSMNIREKIEDKENQFESFKIVAQELEMAKHRATIKCPTDAFQDFKGKLIYVSHYIEVKVDTTTCITNPVLTIPIQVGSARPESNYGSKKEKESEEEELDLEGSIIGEKAFVPHSSFIQGKLIVDDEHADDDINSEQEEEEEEEYVLSAENLVKELSHYHGGFAIIKEKLDEPVWTFLFQTLTPTYFKLIIVESDYPFERVDVAELLAKKNYQLHLHLCCRSTSSMCYMEQKIND